MMIQLYAKIDSLTPMESLEHCTKNTVITNPKDPDYLGYSYTDTLTDIKAHGIKHSLQVLPNGWIVNGNRRYWIAKQLGIKWLPIDLQFFVGLVVHEHRMHSLHSETWNLARQDIYSRKEVK